MAAYDRVNISKIHILFDSFHNIILIEVAILKSLTFELIPKTFCANLFHKRGRHLASLC